MQQNITNITIPNNRERESKNSFRFFNFNDFFRKKRHLLFFTKKILELEQHLIKLQKNKLEAKIEIKKMY